MCGLVELGFSFGFGVITVFVDFVDGVENAFARFFVICYYLWSVFSFKLGVIGGSVGGLVCVEGGTVRGWVARGIAGIVGSCLERRDYVFLS